MNSLGSCAEGSNTDSGAKVGVYCRDTATILYLAFINRNLLKIIFNN